MRPVRALQCNTTLATIYPMRPNRLLCSKIVRLMGRFRITSEDFSLPHESTSGLRRGLVKLSGGSSHRAAAFPIIEQLDSRYLIVGL
uniref:Uncharacterized protein n=1 Tax=Heliothis virescens TaxID=7102 RepID=A0A2A4JLL0_HELVI